MIRVLFVDDEPNILEGLRNALRKDRSRWDMSFVTSGSAALLELERQPRDIVVSDMRMPGMDGAHLLEQVRARFPGTARVVLTGQASKQEIMRLVPVAQQILSKPCETPELRATIERLCLVQELLGNEQIKALVGGLENLPSFPKSYGQISDAMQRDDASEAEIVKIVEEDPALSTRTLALANSSYFGRARSPTSVRAAVQQVGFSNLRALALSAGIFAQIESSLLRSRTLRNLPDNSVLRANLARKFVLDRVRADEAFTAGLLLDIGQIVLAQSQSSDYVDLLSLAEDDHLPVVEVEAKHLKFTHADVGAYLLGIWGLPAPLVQLVACHHQPALDLMASDPVAAAVHVADVLVDGLAAGSSDPLAGVAGAVRARPEIAARLDEWLSVARQLTTR